MLFKVKKNLKASLVLTLFLAALAVALKYSLGLDWRIYGTGGILPAFVFGLGAIMASNLVLLTLLVLIFHTGFVKRYMDLARYFSGQTAAEIIAGGLLAGAEEMVFRGVLLQGMVQLLGVEPVYAVIAAALPFGALHIINDRKLAAFSIWAVWEGIVLGAVYVYTGSWLVTALVHAAHDVIGFTVFAVQRRRGFLPFKRHPGF